MNKKDLILAFIKRNRIAVISTVGENKPESAVLEFGETSNLELIIDTFISSRKYKNFQTNKNVSFVIGWDNDITVQYEGVAQEIKGKEAEKYKQVYWKKNPEARRWESVEGITYFKVTPKWIRYSDLNKEPWEIIEISSF
jgi:general stress protein 26